MKHWTLNDVGLAVGLSSVLILAACSTLAPQAPLPPPPLIVAASPPKPTIIVKQTCIHADQWAPGDQAKAEAALKLIVKSNPYARHVLMEWARLRSDAKACLDAQK